MSSGIWEICGLGSCSLLYQDGEENKSGCTGEESPYIGDNDVCFTLNIFISQGETEILLKETVHINHLLSNTASRVSYDFVFRLMLMGLTEESSSHNESWFVSNLTKLEIC